MGYTPWYKHAVFYELYLKGFYDSNGDGIGDVRGLIEKLDYLQELGIDCIWLPPIYPSPERDDGYDVADYYTIAPKYGTMQDFQELLKEVHKRDMKLIIDLVLNHTSDQHPWFQEAKKGPTSPYFHYYVWSKTPEKYKEARIIFLDTETSNWAYCEENGYYYWHRFYSHQPDLNYDNPEVRREMKKVLLYWLDMGVDGFRVDAVPYLFEREGTNCENLPETHEYLKELRAMVEKHYPEAILLAEANQWPQDLLPYFGNGDEFHMAFNFPLMPRLFMALKTRDVSPIVKIMEGLPEIPVQCQWCNFLRNHDELTLEMVTPEEREYMWKMYAPEKRMRLNLGIRRRLAPLLDNDQRKIRLLHSVLFTLPGTPILYYGDEIGMGDNIALPDRNGVRTPMQWNTSRNAGFSVAPPERLYAPVIEKGDFSYQKVNVEIASHDPSSLFSWIKGWIALRKRNPVFGMGKIEFFSGKDPALLWYRVYDGKEEVLVFAFFGDMEKEIVLDMRQWQGKTLIDIEGKKPTFSLNKETVVWKFSPYEYKVFLVK
ncbi:Trehalose synthase [Brevinematales bacterium NS]|nr:maltose alpha-D-glucosyltransferase [Brevinematales bacterium]QJR23171.1 Trehalose synthase [Brevinematales bacterium NS]